MKQQRRAGISTNRYMLLVGIFISLSIIALGIDKLIPAGAVATADIDTFGPLVGAELLLALLGLIACPIAAWLYLEECQTNNQWRLLWGTCALALITEPFYDRVVTGEWFGFATIRPSNLAWALVVCFLVEKFITHQPWPIQVAVVLAGLAWLVIFQVGQWLPFIPAGLVIYAFFIMFHYLRDRENTMMLTAGMLGAVCFITPALGVALLHYRAGENNLGDTPGHGQGQAQRPSFWWLLWYPVAFACLTLVVSIR